MLLNMCKGKIHRATVTDANLNYQGSITVDASLLEQAGILPYEMVQVLNISNGARIETYAIRGEPGSGTICLNGAAARWFQPGDTIIILAAAMMTPEEADGFTPRIVFVDCHNRMIQSPDIPAGG